jgi:hypothetical protein
VKAL